MDERRVSGISEPGRYYLDAGPASISAEVLTRDGRKLLSGQPAQLVDDLLRGLVWSNRIDFTEFFRAGRDGTKPVDFLQTDFAEQTRELRCFEGFVKHPAIKDNVVSAYEIYRLQVGENPGKENSCQTFVLEDQGSFSALDASYYPSNLRFGSFSLKVYFYPELQEIMHYREGRLPYRATIDWQDTDPRDSQKRAHGVLFDRIFPRLNSLHHLRIVTDNLR